MLYVCCESFLVVVLFNFSMFVMKTKSYVSLLGIDDDKCLIRCMFTRRKFDDGYLNQRQTETIKIEEIHRSTGRVMSQTTSTGYRYASYLHNNWGWNGSRNGYYVSGSFDSNAAGILSSTKSGESYNYQYEINIFPYITR
jgi:hypothetical protein